MAYLLQSVVRQEEVGTDGSEWHLQSRFKLALDEYVQCKADTRILIHFVCIHIYIYIHIHGILHVYIYIYTYIDIGVVCVYTNMYTPACTSDLCRMLLSRSVDMQPRLDNSGGIFLEVPLPWCSIYCFD